MWITSSLDTVRTPTYVALGNFDGVHQGHRQVIRPIFRAASLSDLPGSLHPESQVVTIETESRLPYATVVTFQPHPQEFFTGQRRILLSPLEEKIYYLREMGVEQLVLLPFDQRLATLAPDQFVKQILIQGLRANQISVGQDFRFGQKRAGTTADLRAIATAHHIPITVAPLHTWDGERISSSGIRLALAQGEVQRANQLLGRPYRLVGNVVQGQQLGRTIGFPTANLHLPPDKCLPRQGVYSVWVHLGSLESQTSPLPGVMNIGCRPTVDGTQQTVEVHLLDWTGDLYQQSLVVSLDSFLRPEQKFAGLDDLKGQIAQDCEVARSRLATAL